MTSRLFFVGKGEPSTLLINFYSSQPPLGGGRFVSSVPSRRSLNADAYVTESVQLRLGYKRLWTVDS